MQSLLKIKWVIFIIILNIIVSILCNPIIFLNENQILYSMSTLAQVIAGVFGLVLAAYAIIDPKLKDIGKQNKQSSDYVYTLRSRYFNNIIVLSIMCAITIVSCLASINLYGALNNNFFPIIINQAFIFGILSLLCFLYFGCSLLNPNAFSVLGEEEKKEIEIGYSSKLQDEDFKPFVAYYNKFESLILEFATSLMNEELQVKQHQEHKTGRLQIFQAIDILLAHEIVNKKIAEKIDELRRYRNALVHSTDDQKVNAFIFDQLKQLYIKLNAIYDAKEIPQDKERAIKELYDYGDSISLNQLDQNMLVFIKENEGVSVKEIAEYLQISKAFLSKHLQKLIRIGEIKEIDSKFFIKQN